MQNRQSKTFRSLLLVLALVLACAVTGYAGDGVIEINQASVIAAGGFPFQITDSGSYRLTGNLDVNATDVDAISINTSNVTLDLNGFTINGPGSGSGRGVVSAAGNNITVVNGTIRNMGAAGIGINNNSHVERVHALNNGGTGIYINGSGNVVNNNIASGNSDAGVYIAGNSMANYNVAFQNGATGIVCNSQCTVHGNVSMENGGDGIHCSFCVVMENKVGNNTGYGISGGNIAYGHNHLRSNSAGNVVSPPAAIQIDTNFCLTDTTCP